MWEKRAERRTRTKGGEAHTKVTSDDYATSRLRKRGKRIGQSGVCGSGGVKGELPDLEVNGGQGAIRPWAAVMELLIR